MSLLYLHLFNERKGLNPAAPDHIFSGPFIGPLTGFYWERGELYVGYGMNGYRLIFSDEKDHIRYGGSVYNAFRIMTSYQMKQMAMLFDEPPEEYHTIDMFLKLNGV